MASSSNSSGTDVGSTQRPPGASRRIRVTARICQIAIGVVFLVAGGAKVWNPILFYWESLPFIQGVLRLGPNVAPAVSRIALLMGVVECGLGLALVMSWKPKATLRFGVILMALFLLLTVSAWAQGFDAKCGCFGTLLERGPGEATAENTIMLAMLLFALVKRDALPSASDRLARRAVTGGVLLALLVAGVRFFPEMGRLEGSDLQVGLRLESLEVSGTNVDLHRGAYLVQLFSPTCKHCKEKVKDVNRLSTMPGAPQVVALSPFETNSSEIKRFVNRWRPNYKIATISYADFARLVHGHGFPRMAYVRNGEILAVWEANQFPTRAQIKRLFQSSS